MIPGRRGSGRPLPATPNPLVAGSLLWIDLPGGGPALVEVLDLRAGVFIAD